MSVYDERREELEKHELMMGAERGRLAITLDLLTDALVLGGQHGVYCQSAGQAGHGQPDDLKVLDRREGVGIECDGGTEAQQGRARGRLIGQAICSRTN